MTQDQTTTPHKSTLNDIHVNSEEILLTPHELSDELPLLAPGREFVKKARSVISNIIHKTFIGSGTGVPVNFVLKFMHRS